MLLFLGLNGFGEVYVDQMDFDVVGVTRHNPSTHDTFVLVSHTAFSAATGFRHVKPLVVEGKMVEIVLEARISKNNQESEFKVRY